HTAMDERYVIQRREPMAENVKPNGLNAETEERPLFLSRLEDCSEGSRDGMKGVAPLHVSIVLPAYNEEHAVASIVQQIGKVLVGAGIDYEILVVDDGSIDDTARLAE